MGHRPSAARGDHQGHHPGRPGGDGLGGVPKAGQGDLEHLRAGPDQLPEQVQVV